MMSRSSLLPAGLAVLTMLAASTGARADNPANPSKHECVEASEAGQHLQQTAKLGDARTKLTVCVAESCPGPVREDCARRLEDVSKAMPSVLFAFKDASGDDVPAVVVSVDGAPIADRAAGKSIEVDPGDHLFRFEAPGQGPTERRLTLREGEKNRQERVAFAPLSPATASPPAPRVEVSTGTSRNGEATGPMRVIAFAAGGAGVIGLGVGIGAGLAATSKHATLAGECQSNGACPTSAQGDLDSFHSLRTATTVAYVIGAAGVIGGVVLWLTAPSNREHGATAQLWLGPASAGIGGRF